MKPRNLRELITAGYIFPAWLPEKNDYLLNSRGAEERRSIIARGQKDSLPESLDYLDLGKLDRVNGYFVFLTSKDYGAVSPLMWNTLFEARKLNLRAIYFVGNPEKAQEVVGALKADAKVLGGGFGSGWKEQQRYLDRTEPSDLLSVNNLARDISTGELVGFNTDVPGLIYPLERKFEEIGTPGLEDKKIVLFGAGGVGKEIARGFARRNVEKLVILNRSVAKAESIARDANEIEEGVADFGEEESAPEHLKDADAVINVSKKGAEPLHEYSAFAPADTEDPEGVKKNNQRALEISRQLARTNYSLIVYDINLPQSGTPRTLEIAREGGLTNLIDGKGMVVNQGIIAVRNVAKLNPEIFGEGLTDEEIERVFKGVA